MINRIIEYSVRNRLLVLMLTAVVAALGWVALRHIRLDAIPDLSDVQVIIVTEFPGQNPRVVEDQVTYPLTTAMLSVPGAATVRGYSMFEISFVYVLFDEGTDLYWARSRVLEYLNFARERLPAGVEPKLGPDATGVGWVYQYALEPGYYCAEHPQGIWRDSAANKWYAAREDAPAPARASLAHVRAFTGAGACPIDGSVLLSAGLDLAQLRAVQDWYMRAPLTAVPGVSEVATIGGFVKQYQVILDPQRVQSFHLRLSDIADAIRRSNNEVGGSVVEQSESEYMVRSRGYLEGTADLEQVAVGTGPGGTPILLRDVAQVQIGAEARRCIGELDGLGEAVGGVIISRFGENVWKVIADAKAKLADLEAGLPPGITIKPTYDRSSLISRAVGTLRTAVMEELLVVVLICLLFLGHARSAAAALCVLPIGLLVSIGVMQLLGINANIMSIGGLALAIGVMVDSSIVMIENAHKHLERDREAAAGGAAARDRSAVILDAAREVGPSLFFSLLVITVAFLPIFVLEDQSGRLCRPLAYTKTFAIAAGALLGITLVPVLMVFLVRGRIPREEENPLNRWCAALYAPVFRWVMKRPALTLCIVALLGLSAIYPMRHIGSEFMPPLEEGDLLYMPTTEPNIGVTKSKEILQQTDKLIRTFPEVVSVHGKIGRANTATDPAPLSMLETIVQLETDRSKWRSRREEYFFSSWPELLKWPLTHSFWPESIPITTRELVQGWNDADGTHHAGLDQTVRFPGMTNAWLNPIENRILMLSTGIKTPVGIKILGPDLVVVDELARRSAEAVRGVSGTQSAFPERVFGGYFLDFDIDRLAAARHGLTIGDVQDVIQSAIGGMNISTVVEGRARYPLNLRYARELRDDIPALRSVLVSTAAGAQIPLGQLASIEIAPGTPMIRSENGEQTSWVYVSTGDRDLAGYVAEARRVVDASVPLPAGYSRVWSGQYEQLAKANERLMLVIPVTLALIVFLLYLSTRSWFKIGVILLAVPFSLIGAFWFLWALDYNMSLAVWVGIIALLGVDAETGQMMLLYLENEFARFKQAGRLQSKADLVEAIYEGAVRRIRPKTMTVATDMIGLLPLLWVTGTGAEVTRRLVAPLIGGITVSFMMELAVYPVLFYLAKRRELNRE